MYRVAFEECDITPPIGSIIPGGFGARYSRGVEERLYSRVAVICDSDKKIAIASVDCCGLNKDICDRIKKRAAELCDIEADAVMVMADHIHAGGPTLNWGEEVVRNPAYLDSLVNSTADAIVIANSKLADNVKLETATSDIHDISFIRVYEMADGGLKTNPGLKNPDVIKPYTEIDPELRIIVAKDGDKPMGAIVNFALHPAIVSGNYTNSDFIGVMSKKLKEKYGQEFITVFVNGACGNINHIDVSDESTSKKDRHIYVGEKMADAICEMMSKNMTELSSPVNFANKNVSLGVRRPDDKAILSALKHLTDLGKDYETRTPHVAGYQETFFAMQAFMRMLDKRNEIDSYVQMLDIAGIKLFGFPAQIFVEYGKKVKSKVEAAMVSAFANDYLGYCPVPEVMVPGVYEASLCATSMLAGDSGDRLVETALSMS